MTVWTLYICIFMYNIDLTINTIDVINSSTHLSITSIYLIYLSYLSHLSIHHIYLSIHLSIHHIYLYIYQLELSPHASNGVIASVNNSKTTPHVSKTDRCRPPTTTYLPMPSIPTYLPIPSIPTYLPTYYLPTYTIYL